MHICTLICTCICCRVYGCGSVLEEWVLGDLGYFVPNQDFSACF